MHIKLTNGNPEKYSIGQLRRDNPQVSFPKIIPDSILAQYSVYPYTRPDRPEYDSLTEKAIDGEFEQDAAGNWIMSYTVVQLLQEQAEANVRGKRNSLLQETDWMALNDNTMTETMASYRQALRDITDQDGFPYSVEWPTKQQ